jgi:3-phytase
VRSVAETTPVGHAGDAADDPAIWVNPADHGASLIIGNDKHGALETYDLTGARVQRITTAKKSWGNVDVRGNTVAASNGGVRLFTVTNRRLVQTGLIDTAGEGLCLYQAPDALYVFTVTRAGRVRQYDVATHAKVRDFTVGSEAEGCAADDASSSLFLSQEDKALWRYGAAPSAGTARLSVDTLTSAGGHLVSDIEGLTIAGRYLIASAQYVAKGWASYFVMYDRTTYAYVKSFRVTDGTGSDDCDRTDGVAAYVGDLGPSFPYGLFVCQDNDNVEPAANQDFKLVPWPAIA